jgi:hypothetical protein
MRVLLSSMRLVKMWQARFQFKLRAPVSGFAQKVKDTTGLSRGISCLLLTESKGKY